MQNFSIQKNRKTSVIHKPERLSCIRRLLAIVLILAMVLSLAGCTMPFGGNKPKVNTSRSTEATRKDFDSFIHNIFVDNVTADSVTLNFTLAHPEDFEVPKIDPTLGEFGEDAMKRDLVKMENDYNVLQTFDYSKLTDEQQLIYDELMYLMKESIEGGDYIWYNEVLGPVTGIQAQLPLLLAEFHFYDKEDISIYLDVLKDVDDYFNQIIAFEKEKQKKGFFMSNQTADDIIAQCMDFINKPEENFLITDFEENISSVEGVTDAERQEFINENKKAITETVIPAYEALIKCLKELKSDKNNQEGLCNLKNGKEYYTYLLHVNSGSSRSVSDIESLLEQTIKMSEKKITKVLSASPDSYDEASSVEYPYTDPTEIVEYLKKSCAEDFPDLTNVSYTIKYVPESLQDSLSPALYLTPALDNFSENSIYINNGNNRDMSKIFTTLAHEGYPGHLYQATYFNEKHPHEVRSVFGNGGYSEGWGTYAELYSFQLAGLKDSVASLLQENTIASLCVYAKADIGIHYHGWDIKKTAEYLEEFGYSDNEVKDIYNTLLSDPAV